jgi:AcrR family transcriptional regulator
LDAASRLLESDGREALTMRRIAGEVGSSTSVMYSMFGRKAGVAEALRCEGFEPLHTALAAVDGDEPLVRVAGVGLAYRTCALANRSYYAVMFARPIPGFDPSPAGYEVSLRPLRLLTDAVAECVAARVFSPVDPAHAPWALWAASHRAVRLEPAGYESAIDPAACYRDLVDRAAASFLAPGMPTRRRGRADRRTGPSR